MTSIPDGICVDLETTIAGKIPDHIRPKGEKRYETRLLEVGAVDWQDPTKTFGCLVNPIPSETTLQSSEDLFQWLRSIYQKPEVTLNFWSRVLVYRNSLTPDMFQRKEAPLVWLGRTARNKALDFVHWHNHPSEGPTFVTETQALKGLILFGAGRDWLAHNGKSFDYKILAGCSRRTGFPIPASVQQHDTLHLFRKLLPGHKSYSQPRLYPALFGQKYNAHVAIDDAKALARICRHVMSTELPTDELSSTTASSSRNLQPRETLTATPTVAPTTKKAMDLTFQVQRPSTKKAKAQTPFVRIVPKTLRQIKGIGPKSVAALAAVSITTVSELQKKVETHGAEWLRDHLPFGANWRSVSRTII